MRSLFAASVAAVALFAAPAAFGQTAAPLEDKPAVALNEVEHGFYVGTQVGGMLLFGPSAKSGSGLSPAFTIEISLGYDITDRFSLGLFALGANVDTPAEFVSSNGYLGDFSSLSLGLLVSFAFVGVADDNGIDRFFLGAHAGAGVGLMGPKDVYESVDILARAGLGIEYFTRLRHFSIGLDLDFVYGITNMGAGVMLSPKLKYTF